VNMSTPRVPLAADRPFAIVGDVVLAMLALLSMWTGDVSNL
jgi:hypothetical protein